MIYKVVETLFCRPTDEPVTIVSDFDIKDFPNAKEQAEDYFIKKWFSTSGTVDLWFVLKSNEQVYFLSNDEKRENAQIEAARLAELTGKAFEIVYWAERQAQLITRYKANANF